MVSCCGALAASVNDVHAIKVVPLTQLVLPFESVSNCF